MSKTSDDIDDDTVVISNKSTEKHRARRTIQSISAAGQHHDRHTLAIAASQAIADTGATSIFVMEGTDVLNKRASTKPLTINLPDGRQVQSTHICDIAIPGLPTKLIGHIVPDLKVASLFGIRVLCKAGCKVIFDIDKCDVYYQNKIILRGQKDPSTDLWTLPIVIPPAQVRTTQRSHHSMNGPPRPGPCIGRAPHTVLAGFTHSVRTRANAVKFAHQSLCNPRISTLLKAVRKGFLHGCPNINETLILKYLNPSPATAKGHMKRPRQGIRSTTPKRNTPIITVPHPPDVRTPHPVNDTSTTSASQHSVLSPHAPPRPHLITDTDDDTIANVFGFGAFADKNSGIVYHDLTGSFPFMSLDGSVCFFVLYHYESNCILATPIAGLDDKSIYNAYVARFKELEEKGFKLQLNVMDNQATKHIKQLLTKNECKLQLVEPHNHRVNAAERAIQTFKDAFIAALATTDSDFPLQLWDKLTPQV